MTTARDTCSFKITPSRLYTPLRNPLSGLRGVYNLIEVISSRTENKLRLIDWCLKATFAVFQLYRGSVLSSNVVDRGFKPRPGQTKQYKTPVVLESG
jgi:hypothetical protein